MVHKDGADEVHWGYTNSLLFESQSLCDEAKIGNGAHFKICWRQISKLCSVR